MPTCQLFSMLTEFRPLLAAVWKNYSKNLQLYYTVIPSYCFHGILFPVWVCLVLNSILCGLLVASVGRTGVLKRCVYSLSEMASAVETLRTLRRHQVVWVELISTCNESMTCLKASRHYLASNLALKELILFTTQNQSTIHEMLEDVAAPDLE